MSATVTTTVTTATFFGSVALIAILILFVFLLKKELVASSNSPRSQALSKILNMVIIPLFIAFLAIAASQLMLLFG